jgi:hypothetical protein
MLVYIYIYISHCARLGAMNYICNERNISPTRKNIITLHYFCGGILNQWLNVFLSMIWTYDCPIQHQMDANLFMARPTTYKFVHLLLFLPLNLLFLFHFKSVTLTATHSATTTVICHLFKRTKTCRASSNNVCKGPCCSWSNVQESRNVCLDHYGTQVPYFMPNLYIWGTMCALNLIWPTHLLACPQS